MDFTIVNVFLEFFAALIIAIIFMACLSEKREDGEVDGYFITILESHFAMLVADAFSQLVVADAHNAILLKILATISFALSHTSIALYACYLVNLLKKLGVKKPARVDRMAIWILTAEVIMWVFTLPTDLFVSFDDSGALIEGNLYFISLVGVFIVASAICSLIICYRDVIGKKNTVNTLCYIFLPLICMPLIYVWDSTVVYVAMTLSIIFLYTELHVNQTIEIATKEKIIASQKNELTKNQTRLLVSQMQPHFLYNVLNTIYYLCEKDPSVAQSAISDFSDYLRMNLDSIRGDDVVPFTKELNHAKTYLELEKLRFEDELNVVYNIDVEDFSVPSLSLQPLVENAVKHGIGKKINGGCVTISTKEKNDSIIIEVSDDGVGFDVTEQVFTEKKDGRTHVGMESVENRIRIICDGTMSVESKKGEGTKVRIFIPKEKIQNK